eukprot:11362015-Alexandrium_andersonii.AAC.1
MSASLVGSEMCIRDSCHCPAAGGAPGRLPRQPAGRLACRRDCRVAPAVSYTHLTLPTICSV